MTDPALGIGAARGLVLARHNLRLWRRKRSLRRYRVRAACRDAAPGSWGSYAANGPFQSGTG